MANAVADWIAESTTTVGTGDLLLTGNNVGYNKFRGAVPAGTVWYQIYEGDNKEVGLGTFDGDSTIVRTTVHATLVGNIFDNSNPIPLSLNGQAIVTCTFNAQAYTELYNHTINTSNPHSVTKAQVGLGNVDNTSDVNKPVSTAQNIQIELKMEWQGDWTLRNFFKNDIVRHNTYIFRANKDTVQEPIDPPATTHPDWDFVTQDGAENVTNIYDGVDSTSIVQALSANQGKYLNDLFLSDINMDGGFSNSVYLPVQNYDGGNA